MAGVKGYLLIASGFDSYSKITDTALTLSIEDHKALLHVMMLLLREVATRSDEHLHDLVVIGQNLYEGTAFI